MLGLCETKKISTIIVHSVGTGDSKKMLYVEWYGSIKKVPRPCILVGSQNTCIWRLSLAQRLAPADRASPARALATNAAASRSAAGLRPDIDDLFVTHYIIFMR